MPKKGSASRCTNCVVYRKTLTVMSKRLETARSVDPASKCRLSYHTRDELLLRLTNTQDERRCLKRKVWTLEAQIHQLIERDSVPVSPEMDSFISKTLLEVTPDEAIFKRGSPQHFLWSQQLEQAKKKDKRGMRWHPLMIRWSLAIRHTSPAAYRQLTESGFLALPSERTLKAFLNFTDPISGFNPDILLNLVREAKLGKCKDHEKNVSLVYDEMRISSRLVYSKGTGVLRGFVDGGSINDEIEVFHRKLEEDAETRPLATYVNVFMVRGLVGKLCYPFGYFAGLGFTSAQLFPIVWKATEILESLGFIVRSFVSDGASPNRKFYRIHKEDHQLTYKTKNLHHPDREVFFISDVPHLIKTTRNNLENSHGHNNTRNLMVRLSEESNLSQ